MRNTKVIKKIVICGKGVIFLNSINSALKILNNYKIYCLIEDDDFNEIKQKNFELINKVEFFKIEKNPKLFEIFNKINPDFILLSHFPHIIKDETIEIFKNKIINIHHSDLPKYRGVGPITQAILNGEKIISSTLHFVDKQIDTGPIILKRNFKIQGLTNEQVFNKCIKQDKILVNFFFKILNYKGKIKSKPQIDNNATYFSKSDLSYVSPKINFEKTSNQILLFCLAYTFPSRNMFPILNYKDKNYTIYSIPEIGDRCVGVKCGEFILRKNVLFVSSRDRWLKFKNFKINEQNI